MEASDLQLQVDHLLLEIVLFRVKLVSAPLRTCSILRSLLFDQLSVSCAVVPFLVGGDLVFFGSVLHFIFDLEVYNVISVPRNFAFFFNFDY